MCFAILIKYAIVVVVEVEFVRKQMNDSNFESSMMFSNRRRQRFRMRYFSFFFEHRRMRFSFFFERRRMRFFFFRVATKSLFVFRSRSFRRSRRDNEFESHVKRKAIASNRSTSHDFRAIIHDEKSSSEKTNEKSRNEEDVNVLWIMTNVTNVSNVVVTNATISFF